MKKKNLTSATFFIILSKQIIRDKLLIVTVYCGNCAAYSQKMLWQCLMELH